MRNDLGPRVLLAQCEQFFERKLLVDVAGAVPQHHVGASREFLHVGAQIAVGCEEDRLFGRNRLDDLQGVGRRAADVGLRLDLHRRIDVRNHRMAGVAGAEAAERLGLAAVGQRAARFSGTGMSTFLSGQSTLAVSAMKCTPAKRIVRASTFCASIDSASESPKKSATACTSGSV